MKYVYMYHNKFVGYYLPPFVAEADKERIGEEVRRMVWLDIDEAKKSHLDESELIYIGTFDDSKGDLTLAGEREVVADCAGVFAQRLKFEEKKGGEA